MATSYLLNLILENMGKPFLDFKDLVQEVGIWEFPPATP